MPRWSYSILINESGNPALSFNTLGFGKVCLKYTGFESAQLSGSPLNVARLPSLSSFVIPGFTSETPVSPSHPPPFDLPPQVAAPRPVSTEKQDGPGKGGWSETESARDRSHGPAPFHERGRDCPVRRRSDGGAPSGRDRQWRRRGRG